MWRLALGAQIILRQLSSRKNCRGVSLLELLIALVIGSIIVAGASQYYLLNRYMTNFSRDQQNISNGSVAALTSLGDAIKDAGNGGDTSWSTLPVVIEPETSCDVAGFCSENHDNVSDVIAVRLNPQNNLACNGSLLDDNEIIINRFYIDTATESLNCAAYSVTKNQIIMPTNIILQNNVESMQVQYILSDELTYSSPDFPVGMGVWAVTVSLLISGASENLTTPTDWTYRLLDADPMTFVGTTRQRQIFQSTFIINSTYHIAKDLKSL